MVETSLPTVADTLDFVEKPSVDNKSKVIVAVDDDEDTLDMIGSIAGRAGFSVFKIRNSEKCMELLARVVPKLIILDVQMPGIGGFALCRRIRSSSHLDKVPIAFLTSHKTAADVKSGIGAGGDDFLVKPFNAFELLERIQQWAARGRRQK
jgi:DNA-binding response OmpR family regulator